jgi:DNA polymerase (family X)
MAAHIRELVETGELSLLAEVTAEVPRELARLTRLDGVGPKKAGKLWKELGVVTLDDLEAAVNAGKVAALGGFGAKSAEKILRAIEGLRRHQGRMRRLDAAAEIEPLLDWLGEAPGVEELEVAGSFRRGKETVGDIDILARCDGDAEARRAIIEHFTAYPATERKSWAPATRRGASCWRRGFPWTCGSSPERAGARASTTSRARRSTTWRSGGGPRSWASGSRSTASSGWRMWMRIRSPMSSADPAGGTRSPPPVSASRGERIAGATEAEVFEAVGLRWIPPVLRENRGEIEAAERDGGAGLPSLVSPGDIRGDLHMHTTWSDGKNTVREMAEACRDRGYGWMAITDHSQSLTVANGLTPERLRAQAEEIAEAREAVPEVRIFRGCEVDILKDGSLDLPDDMLEELDLVLAAVHTHFELDEATRPSGSSGPWPTPGSTSWCTPRGACWGGAIPIPSTWRPCSRPPGTTTWRWS